MFPGLGIIVFGIAADLCYTLGWISETLILLCFRGRRLPVAGQPLFAIGLAFSLLLTLVPAISGILNMISMMNRHQKHWL